MSEMIFDPIEVAKTYQWEIEITDDPADAAILGSTALRTLEAMSNDIFAEGRLINVRACGAYVFRHWLESEESYVSLRFDEIAARGKSGGLSFMQNLGNPKLQTIFLAVRETEIHEKQYDKEEPVESLLIAPT